MPDPTASSRFHWRRRLLVRRRSEGHGSLGFAAFAREVAKSYPINVALQTDHCPKDKLDDYVLPLLAASEAEVKAGRDPIFNSHMWDGSAETLEENLRMGRQLLARTAAAHIILEVEIGAVGGEENAIKDKLYSTVADGLATVEALGSVRTAATSRP